MATFAYSGRTRAGETVSGEREADSMEAVVSALRREQVLVTKVNPVKEKAVAKAPKAAKTPKVKSVSAKSLAVFTRQFSVMIDAGLPLVQCLEILGTQEEDKSFGRVILETRAEVENGPSLADAMRKNPKVFDALFSTSARVSRMTRPKFLSSSWVPRISRHWTSGRPASIITENCRVNTARFLALTFLPIFPAFFSPASAALAFAGVMRVTKI